MATWQPFACSLTMASPPEEKGKGVGQKMATLKEMVPRYKGKVRNEWSLVDVLSGDLLA